ncbi:ESX secretion-associated protein EspG [Nocardia gipuzkoensis]|uniref:ESX secretion-associated protein EspG n=1 Tax=Nocardia gipuzkoensis TaxID=2749991 RepID=UPI001E307EE8|nr:ESX secretion-associated protein EspG [Nocardia gipuzkoensis]UGT69188.1 ESX secretion-associated protein EspG [Nocardia gipuzkoensis]
MSRRDWSFTALGFTVLWRAVDRDVLPYPLQYRSTAETVADYESEWKSEAAGLHRRFDESLYSALRVLAEPEARIEMAGFSGNDKLRVHAAVHYRHAVLLVQEPTSSPDRGGAVHMSLIDAEVASRRVIDLLPDAARGSGPGIEISRHELDAEDEEPYRVGAPPTPRVRAEQFFERPRTTVAHIAVYAGPAWDNRPAPARGFHVMDYPDGRYLVRSGDTIKAVPVGTGEVRTQLDRVVHVTVKSFREENDPSFT